jgi:hypothetical protein
VCRASSLTGLLKEITAYFGGDEPVPCGRYPLRLLEKSSDRARLRHLLARGEFKGL